MSNTTRHMTIRMPVATYEALKIVAERMERSIAWVINWKLAGIECHAIDPPDESPVRQLLKAKPSAVLSKLAHSPACKCLMCKGGA